MDSRAPSRTELVVTLAAGVLATLYFLQSATLGPNHTDEGLILGYIDDMARGRLPFYDFVDAYGLLNWVGPVTFYKAAGMRVWGVRLWMVVLKVVSVGAAYVFVRALARRGGPSPTERAPLDGGSFYGALAALWTAILLGAQWQSLQTAYAFLTVVPLVLATWHVLLSAPFRKPRTNAIVAGALTAATIWTKLNTGMFLAAGGLFTYFFWIREPDQEGVAAKPVGARLERALGWARPLGIIAYGVIFSFFMRRHFNQWFCLYLLVPLLLGLAYAYYAAGRRAAAGPALAHLRPFAAYLGTTLSLSLLVLFGYYGTRAGEYARELSGILSNIHYTAPFPPLGKPGPYVGLNEYFWLQLPWAVTLAFLLVALLGLRLGTRALGARWPLRRAQTGALLLLMTLHAYCMYARSDETHIYQAVVLAAPALFAFVGQLDAFVRAAAPKAWLPFRGALALFVVWYSHSLFVVPDAAAFKIERGDWHNPKLEHLHYRGEHGKYVQDFSPNVSDHEWDIIEDATADYVRGITKPDEDVLLLTANRLMFLNSGARPIGGRYHFFFYLASVGLLDREGFDNLVPREVVEDIVKRPPRVIVAAFGYVPLALLFPEFADLRDREYVRTKTYRHIWIYELRRDGKPVPEPLR